MGSADHTGWNIVQIPILSGIYTDTKADFRASYPVNMKPIIMDTGISEGYLRPVEGITQIGTGPGVSRGAINWEGAHYRVMGSRICRILKDGTVVDLGDVGTDGNQVSLTYSFDYLAIASNENLFYLKDDVLTQVTDVDLGDCLDVVWVDGYFMSTDGEFLIVSDLNDPFAFSSTKYGSSEIDPDPVVGLVKNRNEIYAVNRYTIEVFQNIGGSGFPFGRVTGAQIQRGAFGAHCAVVYEQNIAFLGSARDESPGVFLGANGQSRKISTREIDEILATYLETDLQDAVLESVHDRSHALLWVRLPDRTLVFDFEASQAAGSPVWYVMHSGTLDTPLTYRGVDVIWCYDDWQVGDAQSSKVGTLTEDVATQFGSDVPWEISTGIFYNESKGLIIHSLELVALTGRGAFGVDPVISTAYSLDGRNWSQERSVEVGTQGDRLKRVIWRRQGKMRNLRMQRFRGDTKAYMAVARLEAEVEPLSA
jgi:hypothetical protein